MTIHALLPQQQAAPSDDGSTAYDSVWAGPEDVAGASAQQSAAQESTLERTMLSHEKIYVVLAVVLLVWLGVTLLLFRTDRRLSRLERRLDETP